MNLPKRPMIATAPEVRVELLCLTQTCGSLPLRLLSILEQAASAKKERRVLGSFHSLIDLPSDADLNVILDGASRVLIPKNERSILSFGQFSISG